jgi:hypothetical protein
MSKVRAVTPDQVRARAQAAFVTRDQFRGAHEDIYEYITPFRKPLGREGAGAARGQRAYDGTALKSAWRFASRMQRDLLPPFQEFFTLRPGPLVPAGQRADVAAALQGAAAVVSAMFAKGEFQTSAHEMCVDLVSGTGAMLVLEADDDSLVEFQAVPAAEIALEEDGRGRVSGVYWRRHYRLAALREEWPDGRWPTKWLKRIDEAERKGATDQVEMLRAIVRVGKRWRTMVTFWGETDVIAEQEDLRCPMIVARFFKVAGEAYGRGPAHLASPTVATLNKTMELQLRSAALALIGVWTRTSDLALNPDMARLAPGSTIAVARNGGPLGPSLQKLDIPGDFDLSMFIQRELREQVQSLMFDQALPADAGAVKSATEIIEKMKRLGEDLFGAYGRLATEIVEALVARVLEILAKKGVLEEPLKIDNLFAQLNITSPMGAAQNLTEVQRVVEWVSILRSLVGDEMVMLSVVVEKLGAWLATRLGVPTELARTEEETEALQKQAAAVASAQMKQAA